MERHQLGATLGKAMDYATAAEHTTLFVARCYCLMFSLVQHRVECCPEWSLLTEAPAKLQYVLSGTRVNPTEVTQTSARILVITGSEDLVVRVVLNCYLSANFVAEVDSAYLPCDGSPATPKN